jgi:hypothetical protein
MDCTGYLVEDRRAGDIVCVECGLVSQERLIALDAYTNNTKGKGGMDECTVYTNSNRVDLQQQLDMNSIYHRFREDDQFLWDGLEDIDNIADKLWPGERGNQSVITRAKQLFENAFRVQQLEKAEPPSNQSSRRNGPRKKFAKRKQYVVTSLYKALRENGVYTWGIDEIDALAPGNIKVSRKAMSRCMRAVIGPAPPVKCEEPVVPLHPAFRSSYHQRFG